MVFRLARAGWRFLGILLKLPFLPLWLLGRVAARPRADWLVVRVRPRLAEIVSAKKAWMRLFPALRENVPTSLSTLRRLARLASQDPNVRGITFIVPPLMSGWAGAKALRDVFAILQAKGKQVAVHLPDGGGNKEIYVAAAADRFTLSPQAALMTLGLAAESRYVRPLLEKLGVSFEVFARAEYKTALESAVREDMSEPQREQLEALLGTFDADLRAALAARPSMDEAKVDALFDMGLVRGSEAVRAGLVDAIAYEDELPRVLRDGEPKPKPLFPAGRYLAFHDARFWRRLWRAPHLAVVELSGAIGTGQGAKKVIAALRVARGDSRVKGVLLHISSPGGSATVSDSIHREVIRLKEKKPVVACFGDVAASGGYYVGVAADAIVAQPLTITGSIGVIMARLVADEMLEGIGVRTEVVRKAPHADMLSPARPLQDAERAILDREVEGFYREFVRLVAEGRSMDAEEVETLARGRVWSGRDAHERGLVDRLGGFEVALELLRERAGDSTLKPTLLEPRRLDLPPAEAPPQPVAGRLAAEVEQALLDAVHPDAAALLQLVRSGQRVMPFAFGLPTIR
jgi:protease-4